MNNFEILRKAAEIADGKYGTWTYDRWAEFNDRYFGGELIVGGIQWGITPHGRSLGYFEPWRNSITLHVSLIDPEGRNPWSMGQMMGEKMAADVLVHEMMHQHIGQSGGDPSRYTHNSPRWCEEINRMVPLLGIDTELLAIPIKQKRVKDSEVKGSGAVTWAVPDGAMTRTTLSTFPHTLRPDGYYLSA
jgi:hypothetical protein